MTALYVAFFRDETLFKCQTCIIWKILNSPVFHYITVFFFSCWSGKNSCSSLMGSSPHFQKVMFVYRKCQLSCSKANLSFILLLYCFINIPDPWPNQLFTNTICSTKPSLSPTEKPSVTFYYWSIYLPFLCKIQCF